MNCTPDRIQPRIMTLRRSNTPWSEIAKKLDISEAEVMLNVGEILSRFGIKELNKDTMEALTNTARVARGGGPKSPSVTQRQMECLRLYAKGLTYKDIAVTLGFRNAQTVQNHISQACRTIGILKTGRFRLQRAQEYFGKAQPSSPSPVVTLDDPAFQ